MVGTLLLQFSYFCRFMMIETCDQIGFFMFSSSLALCLLAYPFKFVNHHWEKCLCFYYIFVCVLLFFYIFSWKMWTSFVWTRFTIWNTFLMEHADTCILGDNDVDEHAKDYLFSFVWPMYALAWKATWILMREQIHFISPWNSCAIGTYNHNLYD